MKFNYQARTESGEIQAGVVEASDRELAFGILKSHGLFVTALEEFTSPFYSQRLKIFERVGKKEIVLFSRQVAIMLKSKIPLSEIFQILANQTRKRSFKETILKISSAVEGGVALSRALSEHPKLFSPFYISMIKSGEASGKLSDIFIYLADYLEKDYLFRSKIKGAMIYPIFISVVFLAVFILIVVYIIPQLSSVLKESGQELPLITKIVIGLSDFTINYYWVLLLLLIALAGFIYKFPRTAFGKDFLDKNIMRIPIIRFFFQKFYLLRYALNLSTLISGGLPIAQALEISAEIVGSNIYKKIILETRDGVKRGEAISSVLDKYPEFISPFFFQMVVVGEKTGTLGSSLLNAVSFYQDDIDRSLDSFIKLLEPVFIIVLGGVVAGLVAAVLLPMYSMGME